MAASERLRQQMDEIEREIEKIEDCRRMLELCPRPSGLAGLSRDIKVYLLRHDLERRMQFLSSHRRSAYACYRHVHEGRNRPVA